MKYKSIRYFSLLFAFLFAWIIPGEKAPGLEIKDGKKTLIEEWKDTLSYGIAEEVIEAVKAISDSGEESLNEELLTVLSSTLHQDVRTVILDFFIDKEYTGAVDFAVSKIKTYEDEDAAFIIKLWKYLGAVKSAHVSELSDKFIDLEDDGLSLAAIQAIGKVKDKSKGNLLLEKLKDSEFPHSRKTQVIYVLGELSYVEAALALLEIAGNKDEDRGLRMSACEALGKIKDEQAIPVLKGIFSENDALLKVFAAAALSSFEMSMVIDLLMEGLKDSNWKVRVESARALAREGASKAEDILLWKAKNDSVRDVRAESMRALAEIGSGKGLRLIRDTALSEKESPFLRNVAIDLCVKKDIAGSIDTFASIIEIEWTKPPVKQKMLELLAGKTASVQSHLLAEVYAKFMESKNAVVRAYGIRGAALNRMSGLRTKIQDLSENDQSESVRREAARALEKL